MKQLAILTNRKYILLLITLLIFIFSIYNLVIGYSLVNKTFSGFRIGFSLIYSPITPKHWSGYKEFKDYDQIIEVNGIKIHNVEQFKQITENVPVNKTLFYKFKRGNLTFNTKIKPMFFTTKEFFNSYVIIFFISQIYLLISLIIIFKGRKNETTQVLLFITLLFSVTFAGISDYDLTHQFVTLNMYLQVFLAASLIYLGIVLNKDNFSNKTYNTLRIISIIDIFIFSFSINIITGLLRNDIYLFQNSLKVYMAIFYTIAFHTALSFLIFIFLIIYGYIKSKHGTLQKLQNRVILTGSILSFTPYIFFWLIPFVFGYKNSLSTQFLTFILFPFFLLYAAIRFKAFDLEILIRKGLAITTLSGILIFGYFSISYLGIMFFREALNIEHELFIAICAIIATIITSRFSESIFLIIDKTFYRRKLDLIPIHNKFMEDSEAIIDKIKLTELCFKYFYNTIAPLYCSIYIYNRKNDTFELLNSNGEKEFTKTINLPKNDLIDDFMTLLSKYSINYEMIIPLNRGDKAFGFIGFGPKISNMDYLLEEKEFIQGFVNNIAISIHSLLMKEETMKLEVENEKLEKNTKFLKQVTANLSHDLKLPIASAQTILHKIKFKLDRHEKVDKIALQNDLDKILRSFAKVKEYINISLDREMLSLGKLTLSQEEIDIKKVCNDVVNIHSDYIHSRNKHLYINLPEHDVFVLGDRIRFEHVISNIISNAIKYGGNQIDINVISHQDDAEVIISDNGQGIKEDLKDKIFECYVHDSKSNSSMDRSTGLGLFISKAYIDMMKGNISFKSNSSGTSFSINMPIINFQQQKQIDYLEY